MLAIERCYTLRERMPEKKFVDDNGNMVAIAIAPNPLDRRLSRKRKCDSKAAKDGDKDDGDDGDDDEEVNCPRSRDSPMASSNKGAKGQPTGGASKRTKSNIQPKVGLVVDAVYAPLGSGDCGHDCKGVGPMECIQRSAKRLVRGCEKFVLALAYLFCLPLPGSCLARFAYLLADLCTLPWVVYWWYR